MPVDLILLCGFLGSGKTTLLVDFLRQDSAGDTGVIINEAGEIGVDGAIVAESSVPMFELANGCVCCSLRSGLVHTVGALLDAPRAPGRAPLRRIVLETSGMSRPGPIIASLADPELAARDLRVSVVSTYDCEAGADRAEQFEEAAAQLAAAQRIVLTKLDRVPADSIRGHCQAVAGINPLAEVVAETNRARAVEHALAAAPQAIDAGASTPQSDVPEPALLPHPRIRVMKGETSAELAWEDLALWLDDLAGLCGERLLRFKAIVHVTDRPTPVLIQSVGTTFGAPQPLRAYDGQDAFVVIARDIDADEINAMCGGAPVRLANQTRRRARAHSAIAAPKTFRPQPGAHP